jgi:hypothetical protein
MHIYIKDVYDNYGDSILTVPKVPDDILLSCKIAFSELYSSFTNADDEYVLVGVWRCNNVNDIKRVLEVNHFEFELR